MYRSCQKYSPQRTRQINRFKSISMYYRCCIIARIKSVFVMCINVELQYIVNIFSFFFQNPPPKINFLRLPLLRVAQTCMISVHLFVVGFVCMATRTTSWCTILQRSSASRSRSSHPLRNNIEGSRRVAAAARARMCCCHGRVENVNRVSSSRRCTASNGGVLQFMRLFRPRPTE